jgi:hypothetical protein
MNRTAPWALLIAALACAGPAIAHHSSSMFDMTEHLWLRGTVVSYRPINPHALIELEERTEDGQVRRWTVEGPRRDRLVGLGVDDDFLKAGDVIDVCGFFGKDDVLRNQRIHAKVLVTPDGQKWQWGPYGRLESCVDPDDWDSIARGTNPLRPN